MPDEDTLLMKYDRLYRKFMMLRLIAIGAAHIFEDDCSPIYRLIRQQKPELLRTWDDVGTAIFWMRDELLDAPSTPNPTDNSL